VSRSRATVLLVEDDADIRDAVDVVLRDQGYRVIPAIDGQVALEMLMAGAKPHVILLDLMMPRVNGFEFLQRAREILNLARIPVIVVSANQGYDPEDLRVFEVVRKPLEIDRLIDAIERAAA